MHLLGRLHTGRALAAGVALGLPAAAAYAQSCSLPVDVNRSLMVTDAPMNKDAFSFRNVIKKTLETAGSETPTTEAEQEALVNSMIRTFRRKMERNAESGLAVEVEVPQGEAALSPRELLDPTSPSGLVPVGLFNRWDLAPESFKTCGEHRIVFAKKTDSPGRFFLIFEPALPNPNPAAGFEGCKHLC